MRPGMACLSRPGMLRPGGPGHKLPMAQTVSSMLSSTAAISRVHKVLPSSTPARLAGRGRARRTRAAGSCCCPPHPAAQTARAAGPSTAALARHTMVPGRLGRSVERWRQAAALAGPRPAARPQLPCSGCDPVGDQRLMTRAGRLGEQQGGRAGLEVTRCGRLRGDRGWRSIG